MNTAINLNDYSRLAHYLARKVNETADILNIEHDDLYQEAMIGIWQASLKYDASLGVTFINYAIRSANNNIFGYFRHVKAKKRFSNVVFIDDLLNGIFTDWKGFTTDHKTEQLFNAVDTRLAIQQLLVNENFLSRNDREIIKYIYETGETTQKVIGAKIGISRGYVSKLMIKLRSKLAECV